ncbi:FecCD family ABC transporter permease [Actinocrispum wychmicini]|uniref:Iron complex transport system permease protein n=1 Tax=Actinocrispum wychmicini TaxID=1213861 RepID=A0A4R2JTT3_9PSEU|nr:iron ABC transporter permease [Actinocrispum wychmicini]TCO60666.1 iron complex transport system permease protein [Actinocrispum wychmicini]
MLAGCVVLVAVAAVVSMGFGAQAISPNVVWRTLVSPRMDDADLIVRTVRMPRMILAVAVGAALAAGGALLQTMTRNHLAEPGILGVTSGAGFAITVGTVLGSAGSQYAQLVLAVVGAGAAAALVYAVGRNSPLRLLLAGVALTAVLTGISLGFRLTFPDAFDRFRFWSGGSLAGREQVPLTVPLVVIAVALVGAAAVTRQLSTLTLGDDVARALGVHVARARFAVLVLVTVSAGAATAVAGPIVFVGLIVPHLARRLAGSSIPWLMAFSIALGPLLVLVSDVLSRVLLPTGEVPVSIVTAVLGGPVLIWVVRRRGAAPL